MQHTVPAQALTIMMSVLSAHTYVVTVSATPYEYMKKITAVVE